MADKKELLDFVYEKKGPELVQVLNGLGYEAFFEKDCNAAVKRVLSMIAKDDVVSWGGSASVVDSGLLAEVKKNYTVIDRDSAKDSAERVELMRKALTCDVFLTSFNAVSEDGCVVNIDGNGNRTSAIAFGPKTVIALVGMNKVCKTLDDAYSRAKNVAAVINAARFDKMKTPSVHSDPDKICTIIQTLRFCSNKGRIKVVLVGEELGY